MRLGWVLASATITLLACHSASVEPAWVVDLGRPIVAGATKPDGHTLTVVTASGISVLDLDARREVASIAAPGVPLKAIACGASSCWVGGGEHQLGFLGTVDAAAGIIKAIEIGHEVAAITGVILLGDGTVVTTHLDEAAMTWEPRSGRRLARLVIPEGLEIHTVSAWGQQIALGNDKGELILWDGRSQTPDERINLGKGAIMSLIPRGNYLAAGGWQYLAILRDHPVEIEHQTAISNAAILSCTASDQLQLWCGQSDGFLARIGTGANIEGSFKAHRAAIRFVGTQGKSVLTASEDGTVKSWKPD